MINVIAFDPGLRRFGALIAQTDGALHRVFAVDCFESEQRCDDFDIKAADDDVRCARDLARWLAWFTRSIDISVVVAESASYPKSHRAVVCMALAWGVVSAFLDDRSLPLVSVAPSYWRSELTGARPKRGGTKAERRKRTEARERMSHAEVVRAIPTIVPLVRRLPGERQKHVLDAGGVYVWSIGSPDIRRFFR